jgi:hypothetical protein
VCLKYKTFRKLNPLPSVCVSGEKGPTQVGLLGDILDHWTALCILNIPTLYNMSSIIYNDYTTVTDLKRFDNVYVRIKEVISTCYRTGLS